ncbi:FAD-dependent oxidoreductase [Caballeronia telluris]|uniref:Oxidoreductase n=1 Tax=Caballeronia telluris TaxID=326475 RepID=A0A158G2P1_9BURK|nr:FAD-dependent oxidoreductase [Caballeronia telluris]SAL26356.1 oxidoreductase [Caballeronia telluris]
MKIERYDIAIVGAGPAGLRAAQVAAAEGAQVALIDDNPRPGGQIWRQGPGVVPTAPLALWLRGTAPRVAVKSGAKVVSATGTNRLLLESAEGAACIESAHWILATGARELLLPFDGWTLPGVTGAGGLQALIKGGMPVAGERIVIAGSGPLLLAAASTAAQRGGDVRAVVEQASAGRVLRFGATLALTPAKLAQAVALMRAIRVSRYRTGAVVVKAHGTKRVEAVTIRAAGRERSIEADRVACGYGLVPNVALAQALGCALDSNGAIRVDDSQRTSVRGVLAAGECTGVGGMERAWVEGALAAYAALGIDDARVATERRARERWRRFGARVAAAFELGDEARRLPSPDTLICRCEDVSVGALAPHANWRDAKLHTRCGMGPCQGRVCGAAASAYFGWDVGAPREPFSPARIDTLIAAGDIAP